MCKGDFSFLIPILNKQIKHFFCCRFIQLLQLLQFLSCDLFKLFVLLHLFSFFFFFTQLTHKTQSFRLQCIILLFSGWEPSLSIISKYQLLEFENLSYQQMFHNLQLILIRLYQSLVIVIFPNNYDQWQRNI